MTVALGLCIHGDPGPDTDDGFDGHPAVAVDRLLRSYGTKDWDEASHPRGADGRFGDGGGAAPVETPPAKDPLRFADTARRVDQADSLGEQDWRTFGGATRMGGVWQTTQEMNRIVRQTLDYAAENGGSINRQTVFDANVGFEGEPSPPTAADMQEMANCMCQNGGYTSVDYLNDIKACAVYIRGGQRQAPLNTDDLHRGIIVPRKVLDQIVADGKVTLRNSSWSASKTAASVFAGKRNPFVAAEDAPKVRRGQVGVMLQLPPGSARALPVNGQRGYDLIREHVVSGTFAIDHVTTDTDGQMTLHLKAAEA